MVCYICPLTGSLTIKHYLLHTALRLRCLGLPARHNNIIGMVSDARRKTEVKSGSKSKRPPGLIPLRKGNPGRCVHTTIVRDLHIETPTSIIGIGN